MREANAIKTSGHQTNKAFWNYQKAMNKHILPVFGNRHIDAITNLEIEVFISNLTCSSKTKQNILTPFQLVWKHIYLAKVVVKIRRNLVRLKGRKIVNKRSKTDSSIRDVKIPEFIVESLREQRKQTWKGNGDDFVFLNKQGRPICINQAVSIFTWHVVFMWYITSNNIVQIYN